MVEAREGIWRERAAAWHRFSRWIPPESIRERTTRLQWLEEALRLVREREDQDVPFDSPGIRARRRRLRDALERIRD